MADVQSGLTIGGEEGLDPNDSRAFEQIMEGKGVPKEAGEGETPSTDIRSGLTTAEPGQARESDGKFAPASAPAQAPPAAAPDTSQVEGNDDPEVAAYLARYNNDPAAALKAAAGLTSVIGRQGQELGQTREEMAELRGRLEAMAAQSAAPAVTLSDDQIEQQVQERLSSQGYLAAATHAANVLHTTGDSRMYDSIRELWALEQPGAAMDFNTDFRLWQRDEAAKAVAAPAPEQWMLDAREQAQVAGISSSLGKALDGYSQEDKAAITAQFDTAMGSMPKNVLAMVGSADPEARDSGVQLVVDRATLLASRAPATPAAAAVEDPAVAASIERKLKGAAVATSALRKTEPSKTEKTPETIAEATRAFKDAIMAADTTSVRDGLTFGK